MVRSWLIEYLIPWLFAFVVLGIIVQIIDRYIGVPTYRWWYNRGHEPADHIPPDKEVGWFHGQTLRRKHNRALFLSAVQSVLTAIFAKFSVGELVTEIFALVAEAWVLLPGFAIGNIIFEKVLRRQEEIFDAIDNRHEIANGFIERAKRLVTLGNFVTKVTGPRETKKAAPEQPQQKMSASDVLRRHAEGRKQ